jgi:hypothetical protein
MEDVGVFHGHLFCFTAIWYILWSFGIFCGHFGIHINGYLVFSPPVLVCYTKTNLATQVPHGIFKNQLTQSSVALPVLYINIFLSFIFFRYTQHQYISRFKNQHCSAWIP